MKKYIFMAVLMSMFVLLCATIPVSLRTLSSGNALSGEWEKIFDPIELNYYKQTYYFTQLADYFLYSETIHQYDSYGYDYSYKMESSSKLLSEYPLGISFVNPYHTKLKHAFFICYKNTKLSDNPATETETYSTTYDDSDNDGYIDTEHVINRKNNYYEDINNSLFLILNNNYNYQDKIIGLKLTIDHYKNEDFKAKGYYNAPNINTTGYSYGASSSEISNYSTNLISHLCYYQRSEKGDFHTEYSGNNSIFNLSWQQPLFKDEIRADLIFNSNSDNKRNTEDHFDALSDIYDANQSNNHITQSFIQNYKNSYEMSTFETQLRVTYRSNYDQNHERHNQGFWNAGLGLGLYTGDYSNVISEETTQMDQIEDQNAILMSKSTLYELFEENYSGDLGGFRFEAFGNHNSSLNDYLFFGYGLNMNVLNTTQKLTYSNIIKSTETQQNGSSNFESEDFTKNNTIICNYDVKNIVSDINITIPLGLEFRLPKSDLTDHDSFTLRNFCFRLGTLYTHRLYNNDSRKVFKSSYDYYEINYGDGTIENGSEDDFSINVKKSITDIAESNKRFTAGIGYKHSDNLTIDLGGYMDSNKDNYYIGAMFTLKR